jgi:hypothetical protein
MRHCDQKKRRKKKKKNNKNKKKESESAHFCVFFGRFWGKKKEENRWKMEKLNKK